MKRVLFLLCCSVPVPAQTAFQNIYKVSEIIPAQDAASGCNWLTGLRTGGLACYNDVSYINRQAAKATANNPVDIVFDVSVGIGSPILLPASPFVTIEGLSSRDTGIFVLSGSNSTAICNRYPGYRMDCQGGTGGLSPMPVAAGYVTIRRLGINGNRGSEPFQGNSSGTDPRCANWCLGISVANLDYYELDDVYIYDAPTYGSLTSNVNRQVYRDIRIVAPGWGGNTDGIHIDGPCGTYDIERAYLQTGADAIAVNLPEGYGGSCGAGTIRDVTYNNSLTAFRTYANGSGTSAGKLGPVALANLKGTTASNNGVTAAVFRLGYSAGGAKNADEVQSISATNVSLSTPGYFVVIANNVGEFRCSNCKWIAPANANPWFYFSAPATVSNAVLTNAGIYRNATGHAAAYWGSVSAGSAIRRFECNGCGVFSEQGQSYAALPYGWDVQAGGAVGTFVMTAMDPANNPTLLNGNEWSRIGNFYGAGVSGFYKDVPFSSLPPATYCGLTASVADASDGGGTRGQEAQVWSNCKNWVVVGK